MKNQKALVGLLADGGLFMLFSNGRWFIPVAAWLYPVFFLRFMRINTPQKGFIGVALVSAIVNPIIFYGTMPVPKSLYFLITIIVMQVCTLCFWLYRKYSGHISGFKSTLLFPALWVSTEFVTSFFPKATWNVLAYTQLQNLALSQIVAVTGIWGLSFLVTWFASVAEWVWSSGFNVRLVKRGVVIYCCCFAFIYGAGLARLHFGPTNTNRVKVAVILQSRNLNKSLAACKWTDADAISNFSRGLEENLLSKTKQAALSGARFVLWQEAAGFIPESREADLTAKVVKLATEERINILMTLWSVPSDFPEHRVVNKLVMIDSAGYIQFSYLKSHPAAPEPIIKGKEVLPVFHSQNASIGAAICFDADFPAFIRQGGKQGIGILFLPANDWSEISRMHADMATMRAIENGFTLVRAAGQGLSKITDSRGQTIAALNFYQSDEQLLIADVPAEHSFTLYPYLGDWFAWSCIVAAFTKLILSLQYRFRRRTELPDVANLQTR